MTTPHPLAEFIHAFADGKKVQFERPDMGWINCTTLLDFSSYSDCKWRFKPDTLVVNGVEVPRLGDEWPEHHGIYAGIARGFDGEPDAHLVLLHDVPKEEMNWADALAWATGLGNGTHVPTRFESALLYANLRDQFKADGWYWTGTQSADFDPFTQYFGYGNQYTSNKAYEARVRAVRRVVIKDAP